MDDEESRNNDQSISGEIVEEQEVVDEKSSQAIVLSNLESLIKSHITNIGRLQSEFKKQKEMFDNVLSNDPTYKEHDAKAKEAVKVKSETKAQILKQPSVIQVSNKMKDIRSELKNFQEELSEYLLEYQRMSGATTIEDEKGEVLEIVNSAKVVKGMSKQ